MSAHITLYLHLSFISLVVKLPVNNQFLFRIQIEALGRVRVENPIPNSGRYILFPKPPDEQPEHKVKQKEEPKVEAVQAEALLPVKEEKKAAPFPRADVVKTNGGSTDSQQRPPDIEYPGENFWDVTITYVDFTNQVSLQFIGEEYSDRHYDLSNEMELHYMDKKAIPGVKEPEVRLAFEV